MKEWGHGASGVTVREGGLTVEQPPAPRKATASADEWSTVTDARGWESDLADLAGWPVTAVDDLEPLGPTARVLEEVLRTRGGIRGGNEGSARAE